MLTNSAFLEGELEEECSGYEGGWRPGLLAGAEPCKDDLPGCHPESISSTRLRCQPAVLSQNQQTEGDPESNQQKIPDRKPRHLQRQDLRPQVHEQAERTSPARTKNVSSACLALYFSSLVVGSQSRWRAVFMIE